MENDFKPKVSIIMNCYNGGTYLRESIESVIKQTYENWELIFWDNQSTDNSKEIFSQFSSDERVKYFYAKNHTSLGEARKEAIAVSTGEWIGFLDTDDLWDFNKIELQLKRTRSNVEFQKIGLVYSHAKLIGSTKVGRTIPDKYKDKPLPEGDLHKMLLFGNFIPLVTGLVLKEAYLKLGAIPENLKFAADYWLYLGITKNYNAVAVQSTTASYRIHDANWTKKQVVEQVEEPIEIIKFYLGQLSSESKTEEFMKLMNVRIAERIIVLLFRFRISDFFRLTFKFSRLDWVLLHGFKYIARILIRGY